MRHDVPGSGVHATDKYRDLKAAEADQALNAGMSGCTFSADHANGTELCTEVIARLKNDFTKKGAPTPLQQTAMLDAFNKLRQGLGEHKKQSDHAGGNTCAQVIAAATQ